MPRYLLRRLKNKVQLTYLTIVPTTTLMSAARDVELLLGSEKGERCEGVDWYTRYRYTCATNLSPGLSKLRSRGYLIS